MSFWHSWLLTEVKEYGQKKVSRYLSDVLSWAVINLVSVKANGITGDKRLPRSKGEAQQAMELGSKVL